MKDNCWLGNFLYTWRDSPFYEPSDSYYKPSDVNFSALSSQQKNISIAQKGTWWTVYPCKPEGNEEQLLHQGWKIHVSAYPKNAEKILEVVASYLVPKGCPFKFALDLKVLEFLNSKAMHRGSSGKFMTIYPTSPKLFREIINDLHALLSGEVGPYILSDLRYKDSRVVYFRYGAFRHKHILDIMGRQVPVMSTPSGEFVPDLREPYFSPPDWAEWPLELEEPQSSEAQGQFVLANRYEILEALSFSNSGGVYLGRDVETNKRVVIKEARPFTNFNEAGDVEQIEPHHFTPGLLTGLAGIGWILLELGEIEAAERMIDYANRHPTLTRDYTFFYGISGVGMTNLKFYLITGDQKYLDFAAMHCRTLANTATYDGAKAYWKNSFSGEEPFLGLGFGQSGVALFLLRAYQLLGEDSILSLGERALSCDLSEGEYVESEVMSFRHEATLEPYVEVGSAGIAKVLLRYGWTEQTRPVLNDLHRKYFVMPGYLFGASGVIDSLLDAYQSTSEPTYLRNLKRPLDGLRRMHLFTPKDSIDYMPSENLPGGMAIPGEGLLRVSCDWGTGCAGTLRVLHRLATSSPADFMLDEVKR